MTDCSRSLGGGLAVHRSAGDANTAVPLCDAAYVEDHCYGNGLDSASVRLA